MRDGFGRRPLLAVITLATALVLPARASQEPTGTGPYDQALASARQAYSDHQWDLAAKRYQALLDQAVAEHADLWEGRALLGLGSVDYNRSKYADATTTLTRAELIFERLGATWEIGETEATFGRLAQVAGNRAEAARRYQLAVSAFEQAGDNRARVINLYNLTSTLDLPREELEPRFSSLREEARALGDRGFEADVLQLWGDRLFLLGEFDRAVEQLEAAEILQTGRDPVHLATIDNSLGRIYRTLGQPAAALDYQLKALAVLDKQSSVLLRVQGLNSVAVAYGALDDKVKARAYYERALKLGDESGVPTLADFARANYGEFLVESGEPARGRSLLLQALPGSLTAYLSVRHLQIGFADLFLGRRDEALADEEICFEELEGMRDKLPASDFLRQGFHSLWQSAYSLAIDLAFSAGRIREALATAELGRSRALLDLLASRNLETAARPPATGLTLRKGDAGVKSASVGAASSVDDLQAAARRLKSTIVLYWVAQDKIYAWVVAADGTVNGAVTGVGHERLDTLIRAITPFAPGPTGPASATTRGGQDVSIALSVTPDWSELYALLIHPIERFLPSGSGAGLTIVPYGPLLNVPFAALRDSHGRYLVERYTLDTLPAIAMLKYTGNDRRANPRDGHVLLVADPAAPPRVRGEPPLARLPGAQAEVRAIAAVLPAGRATTLDADVATEPRVLAAAPHQSVLHFATHAIINDTNPLASFLALGRPADGSTSGQLTAEKIYRLKLDADLVVLSACRSGGGIVNGDGIATLARSFFYAGANSLVVSVWDVADEPTNRLLPAFYAAWIHGAGKAQALRVAQLRLIDDLRAGRVRLATAAGDLVVPENPAFWAGFILVGNPD